MRCMKNEPRESSSTSESGLSGSSSTFGSEGSSLFFLVGLLVTLVLGEVSWLVYLEVSSSKMSHHPVKRLTEDIKDYTVKNIKYKQE